MADKYLAVNAAGRTEETEALTASAGGADAGKIVALDGSGKLDPTVMPTGVGADTASIEASENLAAGDLVNVWDDSGTPKVRKADATSTGKEAVGFVLASVTSGANATVYFEGSISGLSGLTPGAKQYLATTAGARTETAPSATGNVLQPIGRAISATAIAFEPADSVIRA